MSTQPYFLQADILRTAGLLVETYGEMAVAGAFIRADQLKARGDGQGSQRWIRVAQAAENLLSESRPSDAVVH
ncbi:MAG: hypothetical protein HOH04_05945 [Rhodospirillaceae bacterium]|jgi:hypothetical protein|nr:hypothetical protein [Rhodospirillaceae bacterium]